jgi:integrase
MTRKVVDLDPVIPLPRGAVVPVRYGDRHRIEPVGIPGVTPHMFRRTVATVINEKAGVDLAAELLDHTNTKITIQHDIRRNEM